MKITIFNQDGSIKEVREQHFDIPEHLIHFDPDCSFLNITDDDFSVLDSDNRINHNDVYSRLRLLVYHDLSNYCKSVGISKDTSNEDILRTIINIPSFKNKLYFSYYFRIIRQFTGKYTQSLENLKNFHKEELTEEEKTLFVFNFKIIIDLLIDYVHFDIYCGRIPRSLNLIHRFYYALVKCDKLDQLPSQGKIVMHILSPFSNINSQKSVSLENSRFFSKLIRSLYNTKEECRSDLYRLLIMLDTSLYLYNNNSVSSGNTILGMMRMRKTQCVFGEDLSNKIENLKIELEKEEIVALYSGVASEQMKNMVKNVLNDQYERFCSLNKEYYANETIKKVKLHFGNSYIESNSRKYWKDYYYIRLNQLNDEYTKNLKENHFKEIDWPYYYYKVLVEECSLCQEYKFEGKLLESLIKLFLQKKYEKKVALYEQVFCLNYIEKQAGYIYSIETTIEKIEEVNDNELRNYLNKLEQGEYREITQNILNGNIICTPDVVIDYAMVLLEPLFKKYVVKRIKETSFRDRFRDVLKLDCVFKRLLVNRNFAKIQKNTLQIKALLNIVGILLYEYKNNKGPLSERTNPDFVKDLKKMWGEVIKDGYIRYISGYKHKVDNPKSTNAVFSEQEISIIFIAFSKPY